MTRKTTALKIHLTVVITKFKTLMGCISSPFAAAADWSRVHAAWGTSDACNYLKWSVSGLAIRIKKNVHLLSHLASCLLYPPSCLIILKVYTDYLLAKGSEMKKITDFFKGFSAFYFKFKLVSLRFSLTPGRRWLSSPLQIDFVKSTRTKSFNTIHPNRKRLVTESKIGWLLQAVPDQTFHNSRV